MKQFLLPVLGAICLFGLVSPVNANELDRAYLAEFVKMKTLTFGGDGDEASDNTRVRVAKAYCWYRRQGGTEESWRREVFVEQIQTARRDMPENAEWIKEQLKNEHATMMVIAPEFYCPEFVRR